MLIIVTSRLDHGSRHSSVAAKQLNWFQTEVTERGIVEAFKLAGSRHALDQFININIALMRNLKFQEINRKAIAKILKSKFMFCSFCLSSSHDEASSWYILWRGKTPASYAYR